MIVPVGLTSAEYTSLPTMGQNGTFGPSSDEMASAKAVYRGQAWSEDDGGCVVCSY